MQKINLIKSSNCCILRGKNMFMYVVWNKIHILWQDKKNLNIRNFLCSMASSLPPIVHCISTLYIDQTSCVGRNTCSALKSNILLASTRQLLKDNIPSWYCKGPLRSGLWKLSIIHHLMYSLLCQKTYITVPWLLTGRTVLRAFWMLFPGYHPQIWLE